MKVTVYQHPSGQWAFKLVTAVGVSAGRSTYPTREAAYEAARAQHPDKEIVFE